MKTRVPFYVLLGALAALAVAMLLELFVPVSLAVILGYLLMPVYDRMGRRISSPEVRAALMVVLVLLILAMPALLVVMQVGDDIPRVLRSADLTQTAEKINAWLDSTFGRHVPLQENLAQFLVRVREAIVQRAPRILGAVGNTALGLFIMLYTMFYVLRDGRRAWHAIVEMLPLEEGVKPLMITNVQSSISGVLYGQLITAVVQGLLAGLGYWIFGVSNVLFWTFLTLVTAMVPFVGTAVVWLPLAISRLVVGDKLGGFGLLIYCAVVVMNIDNVIKPRLIAGRSQLHPVAALLGVFGGLQLFGFVGFIIGPVLLGLVVAMLGFHRAMVLRGSVLVDSAPAGD